MIIDASVALKWLTQEPDSAAALELLNGAPPIVPDLIFSEIANGIWKKWRRGELTAVPTLLHTLTAVVQIEPTPPLVVRSIEIAFALNHPAYDCVYLALAEARNDGVITADQRFINTCKGTLFEPLVTAFP